MNDSEKKPSEGLNKKSYPILTTKNLTFDFFIQKGIIQDIVCDIHLPDESFFSPDAIYTLRQMMMTSLIENNNVDIKTLPISHSNVPKSLDKNQNQNGIKDDQIQGDLFVDGYSGKILPDNLRSPSLSIYSTDKSDNIMFLDELIRGVGTAIVNTKTSLDTISVEKRKQTYEKDDLLKMLPLSTFNISNVEISLKFATESVEKDQINGDRILIKTKIEDIATTNNLSEVKFTLNQKSLQPYRIDGQTVLKET